MGRHATTKLAAWRQMRANRQAKAMARELRRTPVPAHPGGILPVPPIEMIGDESFQPMGHISPMGPIERHVPQNTHQPGSIAMTFFQGVGYWRHGA